jgi:hypothetical protein
MKSKSHCLPACICRTVVAALFFLFFFSPTYAKNLTLAWDPNEEPDLSGYIVYRNIGSPGPPYRYSSHLPEDDLADPLNPMVTLTGLQEETKYYIALTAYNSDGNESRFSDSVCAQIIDSAIEMCSSSVNGSSNFNNGSGSSGGCFISVAGLKNTDPISLLFFMFQPFAPLFAVLFLLLIPTTRSIFFKITFKTKGSGVQSSKVQR